MDDRAIELLEQINQKLSVISDQLSGLSTSDAVVEAIGEAVNSIKGGEGIAGSDLSDLYSELGSINTNTI